MNFELTFLCIRSYTIGSTNFESSTHSRKSIHQNFVYFYHRFLEMSIAALSLHTVDMILFISVLLKLYYTQQ